MFTKSQILACAARLTNRQKQRSLDLWTRLIVTVQSAHRSRIKRARQQTPEDISRVSGKVLTTWDEKIEAEAGRSFATAKKQKKQLKADAWTIKMSNLAHNCNKKKRSDHYAK